MNVYLLVAFIVALVSLAIAGLIVLDRYLERKRDERIGKIVSGDVIPAAEEALEVYTESLLNDVSGRIRNWMDENKE